MSYKTELQSNNTDLQSILDMILALGLVDKPLPAVFADASWADIIRACQNNAVPSTWAIGDIHAIDMGGTEYYVQIIGKNHDDFSDGSGKAPLTLQFGVANDSAKDGMYATTYPMNSTNTNVGSWADSVMRNTTLPALKALMPAEIQAAIKPVNKLTSAGSQSTTINTTSDELFLLSEIEIMGYTSHSVAGEGTQYAFYSAGGKKIRYKGGSQNYWWERSPYNSNHSYFCHVYTNGLAVSDSASKSYGVSFGFCLG